MDEARIKEKIRQSREASKHHTPGSFRDVRNQGERMRLEKKLNQKEPTSGDMTIGYIGLAVIVIFVLWMFFSIAAAG